MSNLNILFYSNNCNHSKNLIELIKKENKLSNFKLICVDINKNIPANIQKVPTLIVKNLNAPLEGNAAFNWVKTVSKFNEQTNNIKYVKKNNDILVKKSIFKGINKNDSSNMSDNYAFIENKDIVKKNMFYIKNKNQKIINKNKKINNNSKNDLKKIIEQRKKPIIDFSKINFNT